MKERIEKLARTESRMAVLSLSVGMIYIVMIPLAAADGAVLGTAILAVLGMFSVWLLGAVWYSARSDRQILETILEVEETVLS